MAYKRHEKAIIAFGKKVRELRLSKNITQAELAKKADLELSQINRIELGKINTSISHALILSEALEVPHQLLFDFEF